jgi:hypothetical protein
LNKRGSFGHPCGCVWPARARSPPGEASEEPADPMRPPPAVPRQRTAWARAHARASPSGAGRSTLDVARADTSDGGGPDGSAVDQARAEARPRTTPGLGSAPTPGPSSHASPATGSGRSRMTTVQWGGTRYMLPSSLMCQRLGAVPYEFHESCTCSHRCFGLQYRNRGLLRRHHAVHAWMVGDPSLPGLFTGGYAGSGCQGL